MSVVRIADSIEAEMEEKVRRLKVGKGKSVRTALVYEGSLSQKVIDDGYFDFLVPVADLLNQG